MDDITVDETIELDSNKDIAITSYSEDGSTNSLIRGDSLTSYVISSTSGNLILDNIIIDGNNVEAEGGFSI